eukprot:5979391-Amphidinium_carterae.1
MVQLDRTNTLHAASSNTRNDDAITAHVLRISTPLLPRANQQVAICQELGQSNFKLSAIF